MMIIYGEDIGLSVEVRPQLWTREILGPHTQDQIVIVQEAGLLPTVHIQTLLWPVTSALSIDTNGTFWSTCLSRATNFPLMVLTHVSSPNRSYWVWV